MKIWMLLALLLAAPLHAQTAVTIWLSSQQNNGGDSFAASQPNATTELDDGSGYGASISRMFGARVSGELAIFSTTSAGFANADGESAEAGIDPMIVSAGLRIRF